MLKIFWRWLRMALAGFVPFYTIQFTAIHFLGYSKEAIMWQLVGFVVGLLCSMLWAKLEITFKKY